MIALAHEPRPEPGTLRRRVAAFCARQLAAGVEPTTALLRAEFPRVCPHTLSNYLAAIWRERGVVATRVRNYGLTGEDAAERALIEAAIAEVRAEKEARGEPARPYVKRVMRLLMDRWRFDAGGDDA